MTEGLLMLACVCMVAAIVLGAKFPRLWLAFNLVGVFAALVSALGVLAGNPDLDWSGGFQLGGEFLHFRLDGLSAWFLTLVSVAGAAGAVYARGYWSDHHHPFSAPCSRVWWSALVLSMGLVLTISNGLHFLIAWEIFAICGYFLITLEPKRLEVRKAGWLYLAASHAGTLGLFAFFSLLAARTGTWDLGPLRDHAGLAPLFWLVLFGFGVKAGFFPLHIWLPSAHANAPSHVSAILSGVALKMGVYGIVRFSSWLPMPLGAGWVVIGIGATSALLGIAFALVQNDYKRLLAYCSVENIGVILTGLGAALLARSHGDASWGELALAGALLHVWNHGAFKSLLFYSSGAVLHATGTREMSRLGGLWKVMPWTAGCFAVGAVAVCGLPPLNGFVSEWMIYLGLMDATVTKSQTGWAAMPAAIMLAMAGALALATFVKAGAVIFLGAPRTKIASHAHECSAWMRGPMVLMAVVCLAIGLLPGVVWPLISRAVGSWHPAWSAVSSPSPIATLGAAHLTLAVLFVLAGFFLWKKVRVAGIRRASTWDCGYAAPTAKMQYSSGSFGELAGAWFSWIFFPVRKLRRPRGPFPTVAIRIERIPETVLECAITPLGSLVMQISSVARRLQHGRLQSYILYVLVGLVALGIIVLTGSAP